MFKSILCYKHKENIKKKLRSLRNQDTLTPVKKISLIYRSRHGNELSQLFTCGCFFFKSINIKEKDDSKVTWIFYNLPLRTRTGIQISSQGRTANSTTGKHWDSSPRLERFLCNAFFILHSTLLKFSELYISSQLPRT